MNMWVVVCKDFVTEPVATIARAVALLERIETPTKHPSLDCHNEHRVELASAHPVRGSRHKSWLEEEEWEARDDADAGW